MSQWSNCWHLLSKQLLQYGNCLKFKEKIQQEQQKLPKITCCCVYLQLPDDWLVITECISDVPPHKTIACSKLGLKELCLAASYSRWQQWNMTKAFKLTEKQWHPNVSPVISSVHVCNLFNFYCHLLKSQGMLSKVKIISTAGPQTDEKMLKNPLNCSSPKFNIIISLSYARSSQDESTFFALQSQGNTSF